LEEPKETLAKFGEERKKKAGTPGTAKTTITQGMYGGGKKGFVEKGEPSNSPQPNIKAASRG